MHFRSIAIFIISSWVCAGAQPVITLKSVNATRIPLYEKFEANVGLEQTVYNNPFDYHEIDLRAIFTAPSGKTWQIYGFYDNYQNRNVWRIRFAPNEPGEWHFVLTATDRNGTGRSDIALQSFTALPSAHHGWLHVSRDNPHYFIYDDGSSFYGVAAYYPWGVSNGASGLPQLQAAGCNMFGYWNVTYDDGTLIESMSSGLGSYDQNKCNRIDTILDWAEQRGMVVMLAIWPHDLFCKSVSGWPALWNQNPYKLICDVTEIYESETAWAYQEKQYRYIIARWGYSRALGIWEIMNEINGTDGWARGHIPQAEEWTRKVHSFLHAHDPFDRPTTCSMSGGQYWPNGYAAIDVPNVHMYETGWQGKFNGNPMRSSLWTYHSVTGQMWEEFAKPCIMGEAGYLDSYGKYQGGTDEYAMMYHDAIWSSWASGQSCIPVWWAFDPRVMDSKVLAQMKMFAQFVSRIDYAHRAFHPVDAALAHGDAFVMAADTVAFGWVRDEYGYDISGRSLLISGLIDTVYTVDYYDPWTGKTVATHYRPARLGALNDYLPEVQNRIPDLAFIVRRTLTGDQPYRLEIAAEPRRLFGNGSSQSVIQGFILDAAGRFCSRAQPEVTFQLSGPGRLLIPNPVLATNGTIRMVLQSDSLHSGTSRVIASAAGLISDTVDVEISSQQIFDDFERYGTLNTLESIWKARSGTSADVGLVTNPVAAGAQALKVQYEIGNGSPPYAGFFRDISESYVRSRFFRFWYIPDGSQRDLVVLFTETGGRYWSWQTRMADRSPQWIDIALESLTANDGTLSFDLMKIKSISFNILPGAAGNGAGELFFDEFFFTNDVFTVVHPSVEITMPDELALSQNFPNPFNAETEFTYRLSHRSPVNLTLYNLRGQKIVTLVDQMQEAGRHRVKWQAGDQASGVFFYILQLPDRTCEAKAILIK